MSKAFEDIRRRLNRLMAPVCPDCWGKRLRFVREGHHQYSVPCRLCRGTGRILDDTE